MRKFILGIVSLCLLISIAIPAFAIDCKMAVKYFKRGIDLKDTSDPLILLKKQQLFSKAIELCPSLAQAHNNLGDVYEKQGRYEEAIVCYNKARELAPDESIPYFGLGDIYYKTSRPAEAKKWYEKGLKYAGDDAVTIKRLAFATDLQRGDIIKAETIGKMLAAPVSTTRGAGEVVSITFGEGLIPFDFDKADIRDDAKDQLNEIGKALRTLCKGWRDISIEAKTRPSFEIAGHTDSIGTDEYNLNLSRRRADSVIIYLVNECNVPREMLTSLGYGERVPLCSSDTSDKSDPRNVLNRRVEIIKKETAGEGTRSPSFRGVEREPELTMDVGFFYKKSGDNLVHILKEDTRLVSCSDKYFMFFRPAQYCYAYILQEDSSGTVDIIFPRQGDDPLIEKDKAYWVPSFGEAYTLDETRGEEKLYLLVTSKPLESELEGFSHADIARGAIECFGKRAIYVVRPANAAEQIQAEDLDNQPGNINQLLERIEGKGGWVKVVKFWHD